MHLRQVLFATLCLSLLLAETAWAGTPSELARTVAGLDRARILKLAAAALKAEPVALTQFKAERSQGGPHDFYSEGDYWWPDPKKPGGLPYIQRDGETNPNLFAAHRKAVLTLKDNVAALAAAYALTGQDQYAAKAAQLLKVFFLDAPTRMNPSLLYAQAIPGKSPGRGIGIIDTLHLAEVAVAIPFLEKSPAFGADTARGLRQWFAAYLKWMLTHPQGIDERDAKNNHSVAYFVQVATFARLTGNEEALELSRQRFKEVFIMKQQAVDGSFPAELKRTKPYGYSIFQLDNIATLATLLTTPQQDLWLYTLPDERGARHGMEFLYPYLADKAKWVKDGHKPDVMHWEAWPARQPALLFAYLGTGEKKYFDLWKKLEADPRDPEVRRNMAITQPLLWIASPQDIPLQDIPLIK